VKDLATHSGQLERWLGPATIERMSHSMKNWYGPPIAVAGVPGNVWAHKGGDFRGKILAGKEASALDIAQAKVRKFKNRLTAAFHKTARQQIYQANAGFASFADLVAEATAGKRQFYQFSKNGATGVVSATSSLWRLGASPPAGALGAAAAAGTAYTKASTGAFPFNNVSTDTQHLTAAYPLSTVAGNTLLLHDRLFAVAKTINSTATEAVTGVPTRYQSSTTTNPDYIGGNFLAVVVGGTALAATAHNWTVCLYTNQAGTAAQTLPSLTGNASAIVDRLDHPLGQWYAPLATGDTGIKLLTQMQCSALVATGVIDFMIGHPIAFFPCNIANAVCTFDGIMTSFNLVRIFDDACLSFLEVCKSATTATTYTGQFETAYG
jgi:hypothetical protein